MRRCHSECTPRKATHLTTNQYVFTSCNMSANRTGLQIQLVGFPRLKYPRRCLIPIDQAGNDLLYQLSRLRISAKLSAAKVSRRKMDEACSARFDRVPHFLKRNIYSLNIFIWAIALCSHAACKNFAGLFAVRFVLGMCEGSITAGFMIVSSMFYTRNEQTVRVGYWCTCRDQLPTTPCLTRLQF